MYTICYLGSIMIVGAYCVGKVHNMLLSSIMIFGAYWKGRGTQYATLAVL